MYKIKLEAHRTLATYHKAVRKIQVNERLR